MRPLAWMFILCFALLRRELYLVSRCVICYELSSWLPWMCALILFCFLGVLSLLGLVCGERELDFCLACDCGSLLWVGVGYFFLGLSLAWPSLFLWEVLFSMDLVVLLTLFTSSMILRLSWISYNLAFLELLDCLPGPFCWAGMCLPLDSGISRILEFGAYFPKSCTFSPD